MGGTCPNIIFLCSRLITTSNERGDIRRPHTISKMSVKFLPSYIIKSPGTACISGPTQSGKSTFMRKLIKHRDYIFSKAVDRILYCYGTWQDDFKEIQQYNIDFHRGLPKDIEDVNSSSRDG